MDSQRVLRDAQNDTVELSIQSGFSSLAVVLDAYVGINGLDLPSTCYHHPASTELSEGGGNAKL